MYTIICICWDDISQFLSLNNQLKQTVLYLKLKKKHAPKLVGSVANVRITKQPKWEDFTEVTSLNIGSTPHPGFQSPPGLLHV